MTAMGWVATIIVAGLLVPAPWLIIFGHLTGLWRRLRYLHRLAWYRVTFGRRMPRYKGRPGDGPCYLSLRERAVFAVFGWLASQRGVWADEPDYEKRS